MAVYYYTRLSTVELSSVQFYTNKFTAKSAVILFRSSVFAIYDDQKLTFL